MKTETNMKTDLFGNPIKTTPTPITKDRVHELLNDYFVDITLEQFVYLLTNEFENIIEYAQLCEKGKGCKKMSLLFNPHRLTCKTTASKLTIFPAIKDPHHVKNICRAIALRINERHKDVLYGAMYLSPGIGYAYEFPPHIMRDICSEEGITRDSKILDPCAGWGGRMIGASVVCNNYEAFEPASLTYKGLRRLGIYIKNKLQPNFLPIVHKLPFEDGDLKKDYYDLACTSPPYYDTEQYSNEETNSLNRYSSFDTWVDGFYKPLILKTMESLKPGGVFYLNINNRKYPLTETLKSIVGNTYQINSRGSLGFSFSSGLGKDPAKGETFYKIQK